MLRDCQLNFTLSDLHSSVEAACKENSSRLCPLSTNFFVTTTHLKNPSPNVKQRPARKGLIIDDLTTEGSVAMILREVSSGSTFHALQMVFDGIMNEAVLLDNGETKFKQEVSMEP